MLNMENTKRTNQQNKETWKDVVGYENLYKVSNYGNVFSVKNNKILRNNNTTVGYLQVTLSKDNKQKCFHVHRLVGISFIENTKNKKQINHIDGNKTNNKIENLEWATASENGLHSNRVLGNTVWHKGKSGKNTPTSKPVLQYDKTNKLLYKWECALDAVRKFGFDSGCISRCVNNKSKTHAGFIWKYE